MTPNEVIGIIKDKIRDSKNSLERNMNEAALHLYEDGFVDVSVKDGELLLSMTKSGELFFLETISHIFTPAEA